MDLSDIPSDIKEFIAEYIESVGQLDVLLFFYNHPEIGFTPQQISRELRSNDSTAARQIARLHQHGFLNNIKNSSTYIYSPNDELARRVSNLASFYSEFQVAIITLIYDKPTDKLRGFADAFKFKKD